MVGMLPVNVPYEFKIYAGNDDGMWICVCVYVQICIMDACMHVYILMAILICMCIDMCVYA